MLGVERNGPAVVVDGPIDVALAAVGDASVVVIIGVPGIEVDGLAVIGDRAILVALAVVALAAVEVGDGKGGSGLFAGVDHGRAGSDGDLDRIGAALVHAADPLRRHLGKRGPCQSHDCHDGQQKTSHWLAPWDASVSDADAPSIDPLRNHRKAATRAACSAMTRALSRSAVPAASPLTSTLGLDHTGRRGQPLQLSL